MKTVRTSLLKAVALILCSQSISLAATPGSSYSGSTLFSQQHRRDVANTIQPGFTENKGQVRGADGLVQSDVKFVFQQGGIELFLTEHGIAYQFKKVHYPEGYQALAAKPARLQDKEKLKVLREQIRTETFRMDMRLEGANTAARISAEGKSSDYINFYGPQAFEVYQYSKITYHDIYPGIDWMIYAKNGEVKYDFVVSPGSDPGLIRLGFSHHEGIRLSRDGSLRLTNAMGSITEKSPISFQDSKKIASQFVLKGNNVSFDLGAYDVSKTLLIDPAILWNTYYGGSGNETGHSCTTDAAGNVYLAGTGNYGSVLSYQGHQNTYGGGNFDAFLVKFDPAGARLWATYYGGTGSEEGYCCTVDPSGDVYLSGETTSYYDIASGGHQNTIVGFMDAFLAKFNSSGTRIWATYYGNNLGETGLSCSTDAAGNVFLAGETSSANYVASGGFQNTFGGIYDAYLVKFSSSGVRQWATYYGGTGTDYAYSCVADASGNVHLSGGTNSGSGITNGGHQSNSGGGYDAFLVKFDGNGLRLWATYYGGPGTDDSNFCTLDLSGNVYLEGTTGSGANIASGGHQNLYGGGAYDAFLAKFNSSGVRQWGTYYGGTGQELGLACSVDGSGNVYLAGETDSGSNIAVGGYQNTLAGNTDAFLAKFDAGGVRLWCTYFGGTGSENAASIAAGTAGNVYLAGSTNSTLNIAQFGYQNTYGGGTRDSYLIKFCNNPTEPLAIIGNTAACAGTTLAYSVANDANTALYNWSLPQGWTGASTSGTLFAVPGVNGIFSVSATNACGTSLTQTLSVTVFTTEVSISASNTLICAGEQMALVASGTSFYNWNQGSVNDTLVVSPAFTTIYTVTGSDVSNCIDIKNFTLNVDNCLGLDEKTDKGLRIYPNPATGIFIIEGSRAASIRIYDGLGRVLVESCMSAEKYTVDLTPFGKGIYYLNVANGQNSRMVKLISQ